MTLCGRDIPAESLGPDLEAPQKRRGTGDVLGNLRSATMGSLRQWFLFSDQVRPVQSQVAGRLGTH